MIRVATLNDIPAIKDCAKAAYEIYVERIGREPAPMQANFVAQLATHRMTVFCTSAELAGYVVYRKMTETVLLESVAVYPHYCRRGIGRELISTVEEYAKATGAATVTLYTNVAMTENIDWYPRLGYEETQRVTEDGFKRVYFSKAISP